MSEVSKKFNLIEIAIRMLAPGAPPIFGFLGLGGQTPPAIRELPPVSTRLDRANVVRVKFLTPDDRKWVILRAPQNFWGPLARNPLVRFPQFGACRFF